MDHCQKTEKVFTHRPDSVHVGCLYQHVHIRCAQTRTDTTCHASVNAAGSEHSTACTSHASTIAFAHQRRAPGGGLRLSLKEDGPLARRPPAESRGEACERRRAAGRRRGAPPPGFSRRPARSARGSGKVALASIDLTADNAQYQTQ